MLISTFKYLIKESVGFVLRKFQVHVLIKKLNNNKSLYFVFNYHSFSKYNNYKIKRGSILETGYGDNFDKQIKFFNKHFKFSYPEVFFESVSTNQHSVLVTFDDGYKDNYDMALPVLQKYNASAIFFIVTALTGSKDMLMHDKIRFLVEQRKISKNYLDIPNKINEGENLYDEEVINKVNSVFAEQKIPKRSLMNHDELNEICYKGFKLGVHTHNHNPLIFLNKESQYYEIKSCIDYLSEIDSIKYIAYPNGLVNDMVVEICQDLELKYGFTTQRGFNIKQEERLKIKRIGINVSDSLNVIVLKLALNYIKGLY
ncbi:MAG: polysaccharide deacetylase family protein [Winogradskyella sp.]|jgi:peptidoglycan/xylan/chitin deacetylase (PgdA/CDA1 family)